MQTKSKPNHYVINDDLKHNLLLYKETKSRVAYNLIGKAFIDIATNHLNRPCFINYSQDRKDEMISDAYSVMLRYIEGFNCERDNPFAYFSSVARNATLHYINVHKRHDELYLPLDLVESASDLIVEGDKHQDKYLNKSFKRGYNVRL